MDSTGWAAVVLALAACITATFKGLSGLQRRDSRRLRKAEDEAEALRVRLHDMEAYLWDVQQWATRQGLELPPRPAAVRKLKRRRPA